MFLHRLARHTPSRRHRLASTIISQSGREYDRRLGIFKAEPGNESFVYQRVARLFYYLSLHLADDSAGSCRLRVHVDHSREESILHEPDLLRSRTRQDPVTCRGEAIWGLHEKDWIHIDNILVSWTCDQTGNKTVTDAALGDFDIDFRLEDGLLLRTRHVIGDIISWGEAQKGQTGARRVEGISDIYSFGPVVTNVRLMRCVYALGGGDFLILDDYPELVKRGIRPEQVVLCRHFAYLGLLPDTLLGRVDCEVWTKAPKATSDQARRKVEHRPKLEFEHVVGGDPRLRLMIEQVLRHP
ncbi:kinase-like domain-containing protein [Xylaria acuta]|nr:kinase-like domain-containing protein [Xylaria acuta]